MADGNAIAGAVVGPKSKVNNADEPTSDKFNSYLSRPIFTIVSLILLFLVVTLIGSLFVQYLNYNSGILLASEGNEKINHSIILTYARSWDFAIVKTSALFLSFLLVFTGALYVLRSADSKFLLTVDGKNTTGSLEASSPGLVMITVGVILLVIVLTTNSTVEYSRKIVAGSESVMELPTANQPNRLEPINTPSNTSPESQKGGK